MADRRGYQSSDRKVTDLANPPSGSAPGVPRTVADQTTEAERLCRPGEDANGLAFGICRSCDAGEHEHHHADAVRCDVEFCPCGGGECGVHGCSCPTVSEPAPRPGLTEEIDRG